MEKNEYRRRGDTQEGGSRDKSKEGYGRGNGNWNCINRMAGEEGDRREGEGRARGKE